MFGSRGGIEDTALPLEMHKAPDFLRNNDLEPLENQNSILPAFNVGP